MNFIKELMVEHDVDINAMHAELAVLVEQLDTIVDDLALRQLNEGAMQEPAWWDDVLEMAMKRMDAARRGLGIVNKLKGADRKKHASRVFKNMNEIRKSITSIQLKLKEVITAQEQPQMSQSRQTSVA